MSRKKEILRYEAPWPLYAMNWSVRSNHNLRLAAASYMNHNKNKIQVLTVNDADGEIACTHMADVDYPVNKMMWIPDTHNMYPDLTATCSDYVRLFKLKDDGTMQMECLLDNYKSPGYTQPLTSFDWNGADPNIIGTASIDTSCTVWSLETGRVIGKTSSITGHVKTQLIAHEKEVCDISFNKSPSGYSKFIFASVGFDGSVRVFDLRHLEHSVITYEDPKKAPLMRVGWNRVDPNLLATFALHTNEVVVLDIRMPCIPYARLSSHRDVVSGLSWSPLSARTMVTSSMDNQALIWDVTNMPIEEPQLAYCADGQISNVQWSSTWSDWIAIAFNNCIEMLRV
ncbi:DDB1- and CUL4-associated factor 7-like [Sycon ciliatum]|uniref:DDB1- and CUL4-associated factor 7-like n=1 Tax=Sycon ciliatum TaxID=27933 RepID=UPI0020ADDFFB|eukprot:scpid78764/ scgid20441/ DDB1- and CUL4-associated factor 7; WD repeat-containing protein 68; WD repeat-containing protein An11 homolog &gt; DDB1- and CUL4-associated factor 7; WD repeat-containing protein 68; WD repeat-containing protein An11 homolog